MHNLLLAISFSVAVSILLKIARQRGISVVQAVGANYVVASLLTYFLLKPNYGFWGQNSLISGIVNVGEIQGASLSGIDKFIFYSSQTPVFLALGILLPSVFLILAQAINHNGIVRTDVAQRFSLFLPILWAFLYYGQNLTIMKELSLTLGMLALWLILAKSTGPQPLNFKGVLYLIGVWLGFGVIDILFKQVAKEGVSFSNTLFCTFLLAGIFMAVLLIFQASRWQWQSVLAGLLLGALNFGNIYFYIQAHQVFNQDPALVFATMNIGVIILATLLGAGIFHEKLSKINIGGVVLGVVAIMGLIYGA